jgi:HEPN domain-containing protein
MPKTPRTKSVSPHHVRQYLAKAEEFLATARESLEAERFIAATGNAVHAAITASDAVCGARTGTRAAGQDHGEVLALLRSGRLRRDRARDSSGSILPLKVRAEYEPDDVSKSAAVRAVEAAGKTVAIARRVVPTD